MKIIHLINMNLLDIRRAVVIILVLIIFSGCRKFVQISPPLNQLTTATVFNNDLSATSTIVGIYSRMQQSNGFVSGNYGCLGDLSGLSADELENFSTQSALAQFNNNALLATNADIQGFIWSEAYRYIYTANSVLEGLPGSVGVSAATKQQLTGEAKFIRAFCHFYLVNLFGDVPLVLTTDYQTNALVSRTAASQVYQQIITDLKDAQTILSDDYSFSNGERTRPNKWAATALLSRLYLYTQDWVDAEAQATALIGNSGTYSLPTDLGTVFLKNSSEAIWQMSPVRPGYNTNEGSVFILTDAPDMYALSPNLVNAFEPGDLRFINWVDSIAVNGGTYYYPFKYKVRSSDVLTEYSMLLRLAEQFLIRAEARAQQGNITGAQADLNAIRNRAGLPNITASTRDSVLLAIEHERQVELFTEWGHRWLDLKRTNRADLILGPLKGSNWQSTDQLYPIPQSEIQNDNRLTQNPGY